MPTAASFSARCARRAELAPLLDEAHVLQRLLDGEQQVAGRRRFDEIGEGAGAHGRRRRLGAGVAGQEDHLRVGRGAPQLARQLGAVAVGQPQVDERDVEAARGFASARPRRSRRAG